MKIIFSNHALYRMKEREITKNEVKITLLEPDKLIWKDNTNIAMKLRENGHLLIIIYTDLGKTEKIITVIDTSKVRKYLY